MLDNHIVKFSSIYIKKKLEMRSQLIEKKISNLLFNIIKYYKIANIA